MRKHFRTAVFIVISLFLLLSPYGCSRHQAAPIDTVYNTTEVSGEPQAASSGTNAEIESETESDPVLEPGAVQRQPSVFLYFSDMQPDPETGDYSGLGELLAQAKKSCAAPAMIIIGGDSVNDGGDESEWRAFHDAADEWFKGTVTAAVAGNHDNYDLLAGQFDYPDEAPTEQRRGYFYSLIVGSVFFVMLDSNIMGAADQRDIQWLQNALQSDAARQSDWRIAVMHHPMWTVVDNPKDGQRSETMRDSFLPLLEEYGVSLILCGHQHVYARTLPMRGETLAEDGRGIIQTMAASGDKASYAMGERDYISASAQAPNYVLLTADSDTLVITAYDGDGSIIDEITIFRK